jgi:hypothetical protein
MHAIGHHQYVQETDINISKKGENRTPCLFFYMINEDLIYPKRDK